MANITENKTVVVRYGKEHQRLKELACFGWKLKYKQLLNRFGNPLPSLLSKE